MALENENSRRKFLRNTALASLSIGLLPEVIQASPRVVESETCDPTTLDLYGQGPFYTPDAPMIVENQLAEVDEPGTRLILSGVVKTMDCTAVIPNAIIDLWHANDAGQYDNEGYNLRGVTTSNEQGFYMIQTILPGKYLNGGSYRPSHIHFKITPPDFPTITTQLYFEGDTDIPGDAAASVTSGTYDATHRIIPIALNAQEEYEGTWDIVLDGNGVVGVSDLHLSKGIIYSASPNPFTNEVELFCGVFQAAKVCIQIFNLQGSLVAVLDEQNLQPEKYRVIWRPEQFLPNGVYFAALKINDLQVHYVKIIKV